MLCRAAAACAPRRTARDRLPADDNLLDSREAPTQLTPSRDLKPMPVARDTILTLIDFFSPCLQHLMYTMVNRASAAEDKTSSVIPAWCVPICQQLASDSEHKATQHARVGTDLALVPPNCLFDFRGIGRALLLRFPAETRQENRQHLFAGSLFDLVSLPAPMLGPNLSSRAWGTSRQRR